MSHPLRSYREERKEGLAAFSARVGISKATLSRLENRKQNPRREMVAKLIEATGLSADEVLGLSPSGEGRH